VHKTGEAMTKDGELEGRVRKLEQRFIAAVASAVTLTAVLGVSTVKLGTQLRNESAEVTALQTKIDAMAPTVNQAEATITRTSQEQLKLIQTQANPIVHALVLQNVGILNEQITALQADVKRLKEVTGPRPK
jgi:outer membrane murein-binding lipoprotein Lpp